MSPYSEVRYAGITLTEYLSDALRVAESRGMRLPYVPEEAEGEGTDDGGTGERDAPARLTSGDAPHGA